MMDNEQPVEEPYTEPEWLTEKRKKALEYLGNKWIMHKDNYVQKKSNKRT